VKADDIVDFRDVILSPRPQGLATKHR